MRQAYALLGRLAGSPLAVLITGETGTGKELAAWSLHARSPRAAGAFVAVNCAALPESLIEAELFGHERGAFSGAIAARAGLFETADGGTLFLDEVAELSASAQAKLLRTLDGGRVVRVGDHKERAVDVRVVAATHRALRDEVAAGRFRADLFYRLGGATVYLPPLRDRPLELPLLARRFLAEAGRRARPAHARARRRRARRARRARVARQRARAPGRDGVPRGGVPGGDGARATPAGRAAPGGRRARRPRRRRHRRRRRRPEARTFRALADELDELERRRLREALDATGGVQVHAARLLGVPRRTFIEKLRRHGLRP